MPSFHIESKGTKESKLNRSKIREWVTQIKTDCGYSQIPVIFHKANGEDWTALILVEHVVKFLDPTVWIKVVLGDSVNFVECLSNAEAINRVVATLKNAHVRVGGDKYTEIPNFMYAYEYDKGQVILAVRAEYVIKRMIDFDLSKRINIS